jgi:nitroreductase
METIYKRRSIRKFTAEAVSEEAILKIIKAGMNAPSAGNEQPWQFLVMTDRKLMDSIPSVHPYANMIKQAAAAIVVCGDLTKETHKGYWVQDCAAATENMLLEIVDMGLASVWLGVHPRQDRVDGVRALLGLPEEIIPFAILPVGHAAETKSRNDKFDSKLVHWNSWGHRSK